MKNNGAAQGWTFESQGDGSYELIPQCAPSRRLEVAGVNDGGAGANVDIWEDHNGSDSRWTLEPVGNGYYQIVPKHNNSLRLDVSGAGTANGTNVALWSNNGNAAQRWKLISR